MFEVNNGVTKINGKNSATSSEIYGRKAVDNFYSYAEKPVTSDTFNTAPILDFGLSPDAPERNAKKIEGFLKENDDYLKALPPLQFEYRYMPKVVNGKIDKEALLGAANQEMMKRPEISVDEMDRNFAPSKEFTSKALDINGDGKITNAEYSTSILAADMLSKSDNPDTKNIDGTINEKGMNAVLAYSKKSNAAAATALYSNIYKTYNLG
ncbi:hypothetical protein IKQ21_04445 [bacterium]|nr:hypothetical protein [bacterium]